MTSSYFFLSADMKVHTKTKYNVFELLAELGGLFEICFKVLFFIIVPINNAKFFNKAIRSIYF